MRIATRRGGTHILLHDMPIIKCPGCGHSTSSMALTCPHCSAQIRGHIHRCPGCGAWSFSESEVCPTCGTVISIVEATDKQYVAPPVTPQQPPHRSEHRFTRPCPIEPTGNHGKKPGRRWHRILIYTLVTVLLLAAAAYAAYRYQLCQQERREAIRQELALRIAEDEEANAQKLRQAQQDSATWTRALRAKTIESAHEYIAAYPEGIFVNEAYMLIEELQRRAVSHAERMHITGAVENRLAQVREQFIKDGRRTAKDIQYRISDTLLISKRHLPPDSILYSVSGKVEKVTIPTGKALPDTSVIDLHMTLDKHKNIIDSNIGPSIKR